MGASGRIAKKADGLSAQAYRQVRAAILRGEHSPGEVLFETHLADKLGMSRTPVREALQVLARDGFVEIIPNRGYLVPRLSMSDVRELFELRESLEGLATRCAAIRVTSAEIAELEQLYDRYEREQNWEASVRIGTEFHNRILSLAGNSRLTTILGALNAQISLTRLTQLRDVRGRRDESVLEHRAILKAIQQRDPAAAERLSRAHVRRSSEATLQAFYPERRA
ncbi:MAG TPA: GntR family transcriptional regulator [Myxococcales bacterium]|jgi:DNA-binding GntR family transcriptional regulator|nr:GntR family transcriptional regulator [Myxococcales bacterium]